MSPTRSSPLVPVTDRPSPGPLDHPNRNPAEVELHPVTREVRGPRRAARGDGERRQVTRSVTAR